MARIRCSIAAAFALALLAAHAGCGYENRNASEPAAPKVMPRAKERAPVRALCEWRVKAGGDVESHLLAASIVAPQELRAHSSLSKAVDALRARAEETGLFESVAVRGDDVSAPQEGEVLLVVEEGVATMPEYLDSLHVVGLIPGLYPLLLISTERSTPLAVDFTLRCVDRHGLVIARSSAQTKIFVDAQLMFRWLEEGRVEAEEMARDHAVNVLVAKLTSDESLPAELRRRVAAAPPVAATYPPPAVQRRDPPPSVPPALLAPPPPPPGERTGSTFVLAIGIDRYQDAKISALRFAEADARETYGFFATERRSPTAADRVVLLAGKDATRRGVREAIREHLIKKAIRPEDTVILFFAGHGFRDAEDTYLACADTDLTGLADTAISMEELRSLWGRILCERKVLLVDACHSGAVGAVRGIGGVALAPDPGGGGAPRAAGGTLAISATGENELSTEDQNLGHGVFSLALLRGLRGEADANRDGAVTGEELGPFLQSEVPRLAVRAGGRQMPVVSGAERCPVILSR